ALSAQNLLTAGARVEPVQAASAETETMRGALLLRLETGGETDLNHQRRQESDDESQHGINPNPHHADLVGEDVTTRLGRGSTRHGAFTLDQAAHDFHCSSDAVHLSFSDDGLTRLVKSLSLFAAGIDFRANPIHLLNNRCKKAEDRKSTRLNSSHDQISYAVFCLKKKTQR